MVKNKLSIEPGQVWAANQGTKEPRKVLAVGNSYVIYTKLGHAQFEIQEKSFKAWIRDREAATIDLSSIPDASTFNLCHGNA